MMKLTLVSALPAHNSLSNIQLSWLSFWIVPDFHGKSPTRGAFPMVLSFVAVVQCLTPNHLHRCSNSLGVEFLLAPDLVVVGKAVRHIQSTLTTTLRLRVIECHF